jgi:hypothetical protein
MLRVFLLWQRARLLPDRPLGACFKDTKKARQCRAFEWDGTASGGVDAVAAVHDFGFQLGLESLNLAEDGEATRRGAHLALQLIEHFVQTLCSGPEGRVVLSNAGIHVHGGSSCFLDIIIVFADPQC